MVFGLIGEGVTDHAVLSYILTGFLGYEPEFAPVQPSQDATDAYDPAKHPAGWSETIKYLESGELPEAIPSYDYLVIQIDTDICEKYGVAKHDPETQQELEPAILIDRVCQKLINLMGASFYQTHQDKIIFAVSVHSIECWLLPLHLKDRKKAQAIVGCRARLERQLRKQGKPMQSGKNYHEYLRLAKSFGKRKELMNVYKLNPSLKIFVENLQAINFSN